MLSKCAQSESALLALLPSVPGTDGSAKFAPKPGMAGGSWRCCCLGSQTFTFELLKEMFLSSHFFISFLNVFYYILSIGVGSLIMMRLIKQTN